MNFLQELKRRHVYRVVAAYAVVGWLLIQVTTQVFPVFHLPDWIDQAVVLLILVGFPIALVLAWAFDATPHGIVATDAQDAGANPRMRRRSHRAGTTVGAIGVLIALIAGGAYWQFGRRATSPAAEAAETARVATSRPDGAQRNPGMVAAQPIPAKSIAVLPFENLSSDKDNAYFSDGMQDLILTKLADIGELKVISRTSTMKYASHPDDLKTIAQQLGVATILEGSVQKAGNQVLINVQLIDARSDNHIWAQSYTRTLDNVFGVEGEVAQKIADALKATLSPVESAQLAAVPTTNRAAYDLFLRAEFFANKGNVNYVPADFRAAIPLYRQAIAQDPDFALAYARLSFAESGVVWFGSGEDDVRQLVADARAQAEKALALQSNLVTAYLAFGYNAYWGRQDYPAALKAFAAALKLRPNDAEALAATGYVLRRQGHFDAAIRAMQQALVLDPRNSTIADNLAETCAVVGRYVEAAQYYRRALALDPDNYQARSDYSSLILVSSGDAARALEMAQGEAPQLQLERVQLLMYQRKYPDALSVLAEIPDSADAFNYQSGPKLLWQANLHRLMGDDAQARALYAQALSKSRSRVATLAGNDDKLSFVWNHVAVAELGLGRLDDALAAAAKSQTLSTRSGDRFFGMGVTGLNAGTYAQAGRADLALPLLAKAFPTPPGLGTTYSPATLGLDPVWDPIRHDPRFQVFLQQYAGYKPASADAIVPNAAGPATPASAASNEAAHD
ncbi:tetratricopeptide repeat protein [Rhodanobacter sp. B2A1Ga4]|uniref:tetratricopeptide repeat protein n=1 Tax=Rhodanobacter sp. B2A1Ga4 TaxID=2778647 RepID=UPI001B38DE01|nr:tetratricopeptide repeat protein [Rhodanobacter sp. B2A1Ga4]MBQ4855126.1 tetratricopeptide repeat protein [Rhodanobacter sp. B2A1Ga4]